MNWLEEEYEEARPQNLAPQTQELLYAIYRGDEEELTKVLSSFDTAQKYIHEIDYRRDHQGSTALSVAIHLGRAEIIKLLLDFCKPLSLAEAIRRDSDLLQSHEDEDSYSEFAAWWSSYQPIEPFAIALRALLSTDGDGESIFRILTDHGLSLQGAAECDIGRSLWFWAVRNGYKSLVEAFLNTGFPVELCSSRTGYHHQPPPQPGTRPGSRRPFLIREYVELAPLTSTALWNAIYKGRLDITKLLVESGATLNPQNYQLQTKQVTFSTGEESWGRKCPANPFLAACQRYAGILKTDYGVDETDDPSIKANYLAVITLLLNAGYDPNLDSALATPFDRRDRSTDKECPLIHLFAELNEWSSVDTFLEYGADMLSVSDSGKSLAHYASRCSDASRLKNFIKQGFGVDTQDTDGYTLLHEAVLASSYEAVEFLIRSKADVNLTAKNGTSALLVATEKQDSRIVKALLEAGANADHDTVFSEDLAREGQEIWGRFNASTRSSFFATTPLLAAVGVEIRYASKGSDDDTEHAEAQTNQLEIVKMLVKHGADPVREGWGWGLYLNVMKGHPSGDDEGFTATYPITVAVINRHFESLQFLIGAAGSRLTQLMMNDALCAACVMQYRFMKDDYCVCARPTHCTDEALPEKEVSFLLDVGANPNIVNRQGVTPLHIACSAEQKSQIPLINKLLSCGANVNLKDTDGKTALHYAAVFCPDALPSLLKAGPDLYERDALGRGWKPMEYACAGPRGFKADSISRLRGEDWLHWESPLRLTCALESDDGLSLIESIIDTENLEQRDHNERMLTDRDFDTIENAIHISCKNKSDGPLRLVCKKPRHWYTYAVQTKDYKTPFVLAAESNSTEKVRLIIQGIRIAIGDGPDGEYYLGLNNPGPKEHHYSYITDENIHAANKVDEKEGNEKEGNGEGAGGEEAGGEEADDKNADKTVQKTSTAWHPKHFNWSYDDQTGTTHIKINRDHPSPFLSPCERSLLFNSRTLYGWTALHYAADHGNADMVRLLVAEPNIDLTPPVVRCAPAPLDLAKARGDPLCVAVLREAIAARKEKSAQADSKRSGAENAENGKPRWPTWTGKLLLGMRVGVVCACVAYLWQKHMRQGADERKM